MDSTHGLIARLVIEVNERGAAQEGRRLLAVWAALDDRLADRGSLAELVSAARAAPLGEQDVLVRAMLAATAEMARVGPARELAVLAVVAVFARRLGAIVSAWAAAGVAPCDLAAIEGDLVTECWAAVSAVVSGDRPVPTAPGLALVDRAREPVRAARRTHRRRAALAVPLDAPAAAWAVVATAGDDGSQRPVAEELGVEVAAAVRAGRLSARAGRLVWMTRVAGFSSAETAAAEGCTPAVVRTLRARAERRLVDQHGRSSAEAA